MAPKRLDGLWLFGLALVVNLGAAYFIAQPAYMDAYYYFDGAVRLARGLGFTEPYLWNYLDPVLRLPHPSHLYWMPLTSLVAAPFVAVAERVVSNASQALLFRAAQVPMVLAASALPLLSYAVATQVSRQRRHAVAAALLTIFSAFYLAFWAETDAFALFGLAAAGALLAGHLGGSRRSNVWLFVAGVCAGVAHLARTDGVLILPVMLGLVLYLQLKGREPVVAAGRPGGRWAGSLARLWPCLGGYAVIMAPWMLRNIWVMGAPLAPGGGRLLWLTDYNDLFSYPGSGLTFSRYLAVGWGAIASAKWSALGVNAGNLIAAVGDIVAFPFMLAGLWVLRRQPLFVSALIYAVFLFALMTFAFTFQGARGGFFHSATALLPFAAPAAAVGLDASVEAAARVLKHWQPEKSKPIFTVLLVLCTMGVASLVFRQRLPSGDWLHPEAVQPDAVYAQIGRWLDTAGDTEALVAVNNPPGFYYYTGRPSVVIPNGELDTLRRVVNDFAVHWVVVDANVPDGLRALYDQPDRQAGFRLRQTFTDSAGRPVYVLEVGN